jgi:hypothetical protein
MNVAAWLDTYCADLEEASMVFWLRMVVGTPWEDTVENVLDRMAEAYWKAEYDTVVKNHTRPN